LALRAWTSAGRRGHYHSVHLHRPGGIHLSSRRAPGFADIDAATFQLSPADAARKITARTRAIIAVHLFGQAAPMAETSAPGPATRPRPGGGLRPGHWGRVRGKPVGQFGRWAASVFIRPRSWGGRRRRHGGDGRGTAGPQVAHVRVHGIARRYYHELHGYNSRLDELQAAILRVKLPHLRRWNERRAEIARRYTAGLRGLPLQLPVTAAGNTHVFHVYAILSEQRDALQEFLAARGVGTLIYYPQPLHLQKVYAGLGFREGDFPVAEEVSRKILPLPMYPN